MLSYALAIAVAISSLVLFSTAFLMSDIHRQDDFLWSAVGLIYALVLWFCARNITGAVLLGQAAASILLVSYNWQTLKLRKAVANPDRASEISNFSILRVVNGWLSRPKPQPQVNTTPAVNTTNPKVTESEIAIPDTASSEAKDSGLSKPEVVVETKTEDPSPESETTVTPVAEASSSIESPTATTESPSKSDRPAVVDTDNSISDTVTAKNTEIKNIKANESTTIVNTVAKDGDSEQETTIIVSERSVTVEKEPTSNQAPTTVESTQLSEAQQTSPAIAQKSQDVAVDSSPTQVEDSSKVTPESVVPGKETADSAIADTPEITSEVRPKPQPKDSLDSLETVEVAEVLEAVPEDRSNKSNLDRINIIEVTTTEIDAIANEETQPNREEDSDSKPKNK